LKAIVLREVGGPEKLLLEELPLPEPGDRDVLIRVRACGVNRTLDVALREGKAAFAGAGLPIIPGAEPAGEVVSVGECVHGFSAGDRVSCVPWISCGECPACLDGRENACRSLKLMGVHRNGGYAEYALVPERSLLKLPDEVPFEVAAAVPVNFAAAWHLLVTRGHVSADDKVLILAAGGGLGIAATQICRLYGAEVVVAASTDEKVERAVALGADGGINYREGFAQQALEMTGGHGFDVILDSVGAGTWEDTITSLAHGGRILSCGATGGWNVSIDLRRFYRKHASLVTSSNGTRGEVTRIFEHVAAGRLRPVVSAALPLEQAGEAQKKVSDRARFGKVVLTG
jgi:2-desacetyl-2-hydroxyethyl bacteriochlorophyllide A dehydrogenase